MAATATIKPIETTWAGYHFRSRLEARYGVFWQRLGLKWLYEPEGFDLGGGDLYLPDFLLPELNNTRVEIKPAVDGSAETALYVYLAGKMGDWRDSLCLHGHFHAGPDTGYKHSFGIHNADDSQGPDHVVQDCLQKIIDATAVFAWIDAADSYGTLLEIGYAYARGKNIYLALSSSLMAQVGEKSNPFPDWSNHGEVRKLHDLWFAEKMADRFGVFDSPQKAADQWFGPIGEDERKCARLSSSCNVWLCRGDPLTTNPVTTFFGGNARHRHMSFELLLSSRLPKELIRWAATEARGARFEHGQSPPLHKEFRP